MKLVLNEAEFANQIRRNIFDLVAPVEESMAERFFEMTLANFGIAGADRPKPWAPLKESTIENYRRRKPPVMRKIATLILSGALKNAVHVTDKNRVEIENQDVPYAMAHQYGYAPRNLPARPYFPIDDKGECMPYTFSQLVEAGQQKVDSLL